MNMMVMVGVVGVMLAGGAQAGSYMQLINPETKEIALQVTTQSDPECRAIIKALNQAADNAFSCSQQNLASNLPWRATLRNKARDFVMDIDTDSQAGCEDFKGAVMNGNESNIEVLRQCSVKN